MARRAGPQSSSTAATLLFLLLINATWSSVRGRIIRVESGNSIQAALDEVSPGDEIVINSGQYWEDIETKVDGTANAKIVIRGDGGKSNRENVVLRGGGGLRMFSVKHDHYTIEDFTVNAQAVDDPAEANIDNYRESYRNTPIYVVGSREPTIRDGGYRSAVDNLIVRRMVLKNAGGECIRLRYFVTKAELSDNEISNCGVYDFGFNEGGHNGEGIYVGTSYKWWKSNFKDEPDVCLDNVIKRNIITTKAGEGVEAKHGSIGTIIENNEIYRQTVASTAGINIHGNEAIIRYNHIEDADGAGVRLRAREVNGLEYGINNQIYGNIMKDCEAYGVRIDQHPQGKICDNVITLPPGQVDSDYAYTGGNYDELYDAQSNCTPGAEYLGCFKDKSGQRTMVYGYKDVEGLTNQECIDHCREKGKKYAGTFNAKACRCTSVKWKYKRHGESTQCTKDCPGNDDEKCGGVWAVSTWKV